MENIPDIRLNPPEPKAITICHICGQEIYESEIYGEDDKGPVCVDCAKDILWNMAHEEDSSAVFDFLGYEVKNEPKMPWF